MATCDKCLGDRGFSCRDVKGLTVLGAPIIPSGRILFHRENEIGQIHQTIDGCPIAAGQITVKNFWIEGAAFDIVDGTLTHLTQEQFIARTRPEPVGEHEMTFD